MLFSLQTREVVSSRRAGRCQCVPIGRNMHPHPIQKWMLFMFQAVHIGVESGQIETVFLRTDLGDSGRRLSKNVKST